MELGAASIKEFDTIARLETQAGGDDAVLRVGSPSTPTTTRTITLLRILWNTCTRQGNGGSSSDGQAEAPVATDKLQRL